MKQQQRYEKQLNFYSRNSRSKHKKKILSLNDQLNKKLLIVNRKYPQIHSNSIENFQTLKLNNHFVQKHNNPKTARDKYQNYKMLPKGQAYVKKIIDLQQNIGESDSQEINKNKVDQYLGNQQSKGVSVDLQKLERQSIDERFEIINKQANLEDNKHVVVQKIQIKQQQYTRKKQSLQNTYFLNYLKNMKQVEELDEHQDSKSMKFKSKQIKDFLYQQIQHTKNYDNQQNKQQNLDQSLTSKLMMIEQKMDKNNRDKVIQKQFEQLQSQQLLNSSSLNTQNHQQNSSLIKQRELLLYQLESQKSRRQVVHSLQQFEFQENSREIIDSDQTKKYNHISSPLIFYDSSSKKINIDDETNLIQKPNTEQWINSFTTKENRAQLMKQQFQQLYEKFEQNEKRIHDHQPRKQIHTQNKQLKMEKLYYEYMIIEDNTDYSYYNKVIHTFNAILTKIDPKAKLEFVQSYRILLKNIKNHRIKVIQQKQKSMKKLRQIQAKILLLYGGINCQQWKIDQKEQDVIDQEIFLNKILIQNLITRLKISATK